jgi:hypothetical protein
MMNVYPINLWIGLTPSTEASMTGNLTQHLSVLLKIYTHSTGWTLLVSPFKNFTVSRIPPPLLIGPSNHPNKITFLSARQNIQRKIQ